MKGESDPQGEPEPPHLADEASGYTEHTALLISTSKWALLGAAAGACVAEATRAFHIVGHRRGYAIQRLGFSRSAALEVPLGVPIGPPGRRAHREGPPDRSGPPAGEGAPEGPPEALSYASAREDAMELRAHLRRLLAWDGWANREAIASLRAAVVPPARALRFMSHIPAAERLWLGRLRQDASPVVVWPDQTLDECAVEADAMTRAWSAFLDGLPPAGLERPIAYRNSKGERWTSTGGDILSHVVTHSAYHRGQVASELRAAGFVPAYTDFIHAVRQGLLPAP